MLKKRIIPKLLIKNKTLGRFVRPILVTTRNYEQVFEVGDPLSQAKIYEAQLADELVVLNIDRTPIAQDEPLLEVVEKLASQTFMPIAVGGVCRAWRISRSTSPAAPTRSPSTRRRWTTRP